MTDASADRWPLISTLFNDIVDLEPREQDERLAKIGETDPGLRKAVESLLAADAVVDERLSRFDVGVSDVVRESTVLSFADSPDPLGITGGTFSHFRVHEYLASGGMGVVYRAEDTRLNRPVALKFPLPHHRLDDRAKNRFIREARAAGALDHVNLCTVYEIGESEIGLFLAMPLYNGETLKQRLASGRALSPAQALDIARQIAAGLSHAHHSGIIHRDLKPGNVMLLPDGTVKILDFGLARTDDLTQTKSGVTLGTVSYMAPEQIRGSQVDARVDLWSLGVILYEMLSGARPFTGEHEASIAHAILHEDPQDLSTLRTDLPASVRVVIRSLLEKDPRIRYPDARSLLSDLENIQRGVSPSFRPALRPRAMAWVQRRRLPIALGVTILVTAGLAAAVPRLSATLNRPTKNAEAWEFYSRAREYERSGPMASAESLYVRAISLDSGFALAIARLAIVYAQCRQGGSRDCTRLNIADSRAVQTEKIRTTAQEALRLQPRLADAHFAMGLYWEQREEPARALAAYELARKGLDKAGALHAAIGRAYRVQGHLDRAIAAFDHAIALDPADASSMSDLATTYSRLRRYDESVVWWNRYLARVPDAYQGMMIKGNVYLRWFGTVDTLAAIVDSLPDAVRRSAVGSRVLVARVRNRPDEAIRALDEAPPRSPADTTTGQMPPILRAQVYADMGDSSRARAYFDTARVQLQRTTTAGPRGFRRQVSLGLAYAGLGRSIEAKRAADSALALMPASRNLLLGTTAMRGAAEVFAQVPEFHGLAFALLDSLMRLPAGRELSVPLLRVDPDWKPLRSDPRFEALLMKHSRQDRLR